MDSWSTTCGLIAVCPYTPFSTKGVIAVASTSTGNLLRYPQTLRVQDLCGTVAWATLSANLSGRCRCFLSKLAKLANWSLSGISTQPPKTVDLFAAYLTHSALRTPIYHTVFPSTNVFERKRRTTKLWTIWNDAHVSALFDDVDGCVLGLLGRLSSHPWPVLLLRTFVDFV